MLTSYGKQPAISLLFVQPGRAPATEKLTEQRAVNLHLFFSKSQSTQGYFFLSLKSLISFFFFFFLTLSIVHGRPPSLLYPLLRRISVKPLSTTGRAKSRVKPKLKGHLCDGQWLCEPSVPSPKRR